MVKINEYMNKNYVGIQYRLGRDIVDVMVHRDCSMYVKVNNKVIDGYVLNDDVLEFVNDYVDMNYFILNDEWKKI